MPDKPADAAHTAQGKGSGASGKPASAAHTAEGKGGGEPDAAHIDVKKVAQLARLRLDQAATAKLQQDMESILRMVDVLVRADMDPQLTPLAHPLGIVQRMREDRAQQPDCPQILGDAPESSGDVFLVPQVLDPES